MDRTGGAPQQSEGALYTDAENQGSRWIVILPVLALFALGIGLRLFDLTDQPIDFHPTRQLRGAIVARGIYYTLLPGADPAVRDQAVAFWNSTGQYEPSILESMVALTCIAARSFSGASFVGDSRQGCAESVALARIYNTLFWVIGGIAIFSLARRLAASVTALRHTAKAARLQYAGALVALGLYLALPFSVQASRSFQPDPGMTMWIALAAYGLFRWGERQSWRWTLLAGLCAGMAILTKAVAIFPIAGAMAAVMLFTVFAGAGHGFSPSFQGGSQRVGSTCLLQWASGLLRAALNPRIWVLALLALLPTLLFYLGRQGRASEYFSTWTLALSHLLLEPRFYLGWLDLAQELVTPTALLLGLAGVVLARGLSRALLVGLWLGYILYGLFLPYQMDTHSYYHLQLVPIVALSLAPTIAWVGTYPAHEFPSLKGGGTQKPATLTGSVNPYISAAKTGIFVGLALVILVWFSWQALVPLHGADYRNEPAYWGEIALSLPEDGKIIALTQDYGYRLMYYGWRKVVLWPNRGEIKLSILRGSPKEFETYFAKRTEGRDYFLITAFRQLEDQPALQQMLAENYPILAGGLPPEKGYLIYDLRRRLSP